MTLFWMLLGLLGLTAVLICYSACVVSSRENYVPRDYYEAVVEELCRKHTEEIESMPDIVRCKECKWWTKQSDSIQGQCALSSSYPTGGWFCANGEREGE